MQPTTLSTPAGVSELQCRLSGLTERICRDGRPYKVAILDDASRRLTGFLWEELAQTHPRLDVPGAVAARVSLRQLNGQTVADIRHIRPLAPHEVSNAAKLLPRHLCPEAARGTLDALVTHVEGVMQPHLREFLNRVLLDQRIGPPLLACRASMQHHHSARGGLLIHVMHGLGPVHSMAQAGGLNQEETELTEIAYLLHDLGKLKTVGSGDRRPELGHLVRHEHITPQLLAPHLDWLDTVWPLGSTTLRYVLDYIDRPHASRGYARFAGADVVVMADQLNTASDRGRAMVNLMGRAGTPAMQS